MCGRKRSTTSTPSILLTDGTDLLIVRFARGVDRDVADQKILADADDIDALDVAAGLADSRRDLAELTGLVLYLDAKCKAITGVGCRFITNNIIFSINDNLSFRLSV